MAAGVAVAAVGAGISAFQGAEEAGARKRIARQNAFLARQNAAIQEDRFRRQTRKRMGQARANVGASGILLEGSVLEAFTDSAVEEELAALSIKFGGDINVEGFKNEERAARRSGRNAVIGGITGVASEVIF